MTFLVALVEEQECVIADLEYEIVQYPVGKAPQELVGALEDACFHLEELCEEL
jgi:hypothetical protein